MLQKADPKAFVVSIDRILNDEIFRIAQELDRSLPADRSLQVGWVQEI